MPSDSKRSPQRTPVSTILTPLERSRVDAAAQGLCDALHRESLDEVLSDLRHQKASLVLISVTRYGSQSSSRVAAMVREFPRVPAVALLTETQSSTPHATLALGQLGVRTLVDARLPAGWQTLRNLLASQGSNDLLRSALAQISLDLPGVSKDCWRFFELLFDSSPRISTVRQLARHLNILPSTLMSRFFRAKLPAPKRYLSLARLIRAARLFENPGLSVARVANHLDYISPELRSTCANGDANVASKVQEYLRRTGNAPILSHRAGSSLCRCAVDISALGGISRLDAKTSTGKTD
jgi:AraC-like DNA-binding protein